MTDKTESRPAASKFFAWFDERAAKAMASPFGKALLAHNAGWHVAHTGGGCLCYELTLPGDCWLWLSDEDARLPESVETPCGIGFYHDDESYLESEESLSLADALVMADAYIAMGRPPVGAQGDDMPPMEHLARDAINIVEQVERDLTRIIAGEYAPAEALKILRANLAMLNYRAPWKH